MSSDELMRRHDTALKLAFRSFGGVARIARQRNGAEVIRTIATREALALVAEQVAQERERCAGIAEVHDAFGDIGDSIRRTPKGEKPLSASNKEGG